MVMDGAYPTPQGGASLILSFRLVDKAVLVIGGSTLAASRVFSALEADASVVVLARGPLEDACDELKWRARQNQIRFVDWEELLSVPRSSGQEEEDEELDALEGFLNSLPEISLAIVTDTLFSLTKGNEKGRGEGSAERLSRVFRARRIPANMTDLPRLCDFSFTSTHRFEDPRNGTKTPLQIGVTTNGQGCRLASRLRRDIVAKLPPQVGVAVSNVGKLRLLAKDTSPSSSSLEAEVSTVDEELTKELSEEGIISTPNRPVASRSTSETVLEKRARRIKWVAQVSEYWSITKLAELSEEELDGILVDSNAFSDAVIRPRDQHFQSLHFQPLLPPPPPTPTSTGRILLVGSGPGHPSLLTLATHTALTQLADLVLSDKLVPEAVLSLIPKNTTVQIARKFPGNAEASQNEMMEAAVKAAKQGLTVVRLKQGDPVVYGRGGEEVLYFRSHGFEPVVVPGVSSALAAPTFAGIPVTQRGVAESFIVCTGVGRRGKEVSLPGYDRPRTLIILMGVARLPQVVQALLDTSDEQKRREGKAYPSHLPIAIIERASMPDQRVVASTLGDIVHALESSGEQRPPGMMVIGWSVLALHGGGDVGVLDDEGETGDEARVKRWLGDAAWKVHEGIDDGWQSF